MWVEPTEASGCMGSLLLTVRLQLLPRSMELSVLQPSSQDFLPNSSREEGKGEDEASPGGRTAPLSTFFP